MSTSYIGGATSSFIKVKLWPWGFLNTNLPWSMPSVDVMSFVDNSTDEFTPAWGRSKKRNRHGMITASALYRSKSSKALL